MKIKIQPDTEKVNSIIGMVKGRKKFVEDFEGKIYPTVICENYYEIIKELSTALFLSKGVKFIGEYSHKELIEEMTKELKLDRSFIYFLDDLRIRRNGSLYYGEPFEESYLKNNKEKIEFVIKKLEELLNKEVNKK